MANAECAHCGVLYIDIVGEDIDGPGPDYCPMSGNGEHKYRRCESAS